MARLTASVDDGENMNPIPAPATTMESDSQTVLEGSPLSSEPAVSDMREKPVAAIKPAISNTGFMPCLLKSWAPNKAETRKPKKK